MLHEHVVRRHPQGSFAAPQLGHILSRLDYIAEMRNRHNPSCYSVRLTAGVLSHSELFFQLLRLCCSLFDWPSLDIAVLLLGFEYSTLAYGPVNVKVGKKNTESKMCLGHIQSEKVLA